MADKSIPQNNGGQYTGQFTGGSQSALIYTGAGRLCKVAIITAGTSLFTIYDGTQTTGSTIIYSSITNDASGTVKDVQMPVSNGILVVGTTGAAGLCIGYNKDGALGE